MKVEVGGPNKGIVETRFIILQKALQVTIVGLGQRVTQT